MLNELLLHEVTRRNINWLQSGNAHAILIEGPSGAGKRTVAVAMAAQYLAISNERELAAYPYLKVISPDKNTISIEQIRMLKKFTSLKTVGNNQVRRLIIIEDAEAMPTEAQNALLKILEEPPADTVLILTCSDVKQLKLTILSRVQILYIIPVNLEMARIFYMHRGKQSMAIDRAFTLSKGYVGLLNVLLSNDTAHPLVASIEKAKQLLQAKTYDRLVQVDELSKDKAAALQIVSALLKISLAGLEQSSRKAQPEAIKNWYRRSSLFLRAQKLLSTNTNTKLVLCDMFLQM